jgi:orotate phosphoribosyltransferase
MTELTETVKAFLREFWEIGGIELQPDYDPADTTFNHSKKFKLHGEHPEIPGSPNYIMLRTPDNPKPGKVQGRCLDLVGEVLAEVWVASGLRCGSIAAPPYAGPPLAESMQRAMKGALDVPTVPLVKVGEGNNRCVVATEGAPKLEGDEALVLLPDDVISLADTKREVFLAIDSMGGIVVAVVAVFDYELGGKTLLEKDGFEVFCAVTVKQAFQFWADEGYTTQEVADSVATWIDTAREMLADAV